MKFCDYHRQIMISSEASIQRHLLDILSENVLGEEFKGLVEDIKYATLDGGKRIRYLLVHACAKLLQVEPQIADIPAVAVEMIHAYSLVHDDLPAMDDDDFRRNKPALHIKTGQANAILTGDALQTIAFYIINKQNNNLSDKQARNISQKLAQAAGVKGMVAGQYLDINKKPKIKNHFLYKNKVNKLKTAALIQFACMAGVYLSENVNEDEKNAIAQFGNNLGMLFQNVDDIIDGNNDQKSEDIKNVKIFAQNSHENLRIFGKKADLLHQSVDFLQKRKY